MLNIGCDPVEKIKIINHTNMGLNVLTSDNDTFIVETKESRLYFTGVDTMKPFDGLESVLFPNRFSFISGLGLDSWERRIVSGDSSLYLLFVPYKLYLQDTITTSSILENSWYRKASLQELKASNWTLQFDGIISVPASNSKAIVFIK